MRIDLKKLEAAGWSTGFDESTGIVDIWPNEHSDLGPRVCKLVDQYTNLSALEAEQAVMEFTHRIQQFQLLKLFD